ncbi:alpha-amylase family glycosyl hydrolase, partial [Staphylococcus aureus]|uniref:alpha-amylase family glycosyl hydrolase n=1 Tax=Staphylococcus aureus TaxID=1280 RepID=UPI000AF39989
DSETDEYYLHLFDVSQADLNWDNPEVRQSIYRIVNHWVDIDVDGVRFDVKNRISKGELKDSDKIGKEYYTDGTREHEFLHELNRQTIGNTDIMTVGEMSSPTIENCIKNTQPERQELNRVFNF